MKKRIKYICILMISILSFSCDDELEDPTTDLSSGTLFTSDRNLDAEGTMANPFVIPQNYPIPFIDVSVGGVAREWQISEGGNFLTTFTEADLEGDFSRFIDTSLNTVSTDETIRVLFSESGLNKIEFKTSFRESVPLNLARNDNPLTFDAPVFNEETNLWDVNASFYFDVLEEVNPSFRVLNENEEEILVVNLEDDLTAEQSAEFTNITIEAGSKLIYEDISTPSFLREISDQNRQWVFTGGTPSNATGGRVEVFYNNLGNARAAGSFTHIRQTNSDFLDGRRTKRIPLQIRVVPSTQPYVIVEGSTTIENGRNINVRLSGLISTVSDISVDSFELVSPTAGSLTIDSIEIDSNDASRATLTLSEQIPVADIGSNLMLSYTAPALNPGEDPTLSQVISNDSRNLSSTVTPIEIAISTDSFGANRLAAANNDNVFSVESSNTNVNSANTRGFFVGGRNNRTPNPWLRSTEQANSGEASMKFSSDNGLSTADNVGLQYAVFGDPVGHPAGKYILSFYVYIESGDNLSQIRLVPNASGQNIDFDLSGIGKGEWVQVFQEVDLTADILGPLTNFPNGNPDRRKVRLDFLMLTSLNPSVSGNVRMFIDDISFIALD